MILCLMAEARTWMWSGRVIQRVSGSGMPRTFNTPIVEKRFQDFNRRGRPSPPRSIHRTTAMAGRLLHAEPDQVEGDDLAVALAVHAVVVAILQEGRPDHDEVARGVRCD